MPLSKLDLFAIPFQHNLNGNTKTKNTTLGGILSLVAIVLSFSYLGYLANMYFDGQMQPTVGVMSTFYSQQYEIFFPNNLIAFRFVVNDKTIQEYEQDQGKKFISFKIWHWLKIDERSVTLYVFQPIPCEDEYLQGYYCVDYSKGGTQQNFLTFNYYPTDISNEGFLIGFSYCDVNLESPDTVCATYQETQDLITYNSVGAYMKFVTHQFNASTKQLEKRVQTEIFQASLDLIVISQIKFTKEQLSVQDGVIIQQQSDQEFIQNYSRQDITQSQSNIINAVGVGLYMQVNFQMNQMGNLMKVQYPQITTILAQFSSVFNTLLLLGFISKKVAKSQIIQDFVELNLKVYYKKTAFQLLKASELKENPSQNAIVKSSSLANSLDFKDIYQKIKNMDYQKSLQHFMNSGNLINSNVGFIQKFKYFICNIPCKIFKEGQVSKEKKVYQKLVEETQKSMNIFELQKEILKLKMMIRMILSVEQYAALQVCGAELQVDNQDLQKQRLVKQANQKELLFKAIQIDESQKRDLSNTLPITTINVALTQQQANEQKSHQLQEQQLYLQEQINNRTAALMQNQNNQILVKDEEALFKSIDVDESSRSNFKQTSIRNFPTKQQCEITEIDIELEQKCLTKQQATQQENTQNIEMEYLNQSKSKTQLQQQSNQQSERLKEVWKQTNSSNQQFNNHLEKIDLVENDENYFEECLSNFLNSSSLPKSDIDKRIIDCMVGFNEKSQFKEQFSIQEVMTPFTLR